MIEFSMIAVLRRDRIDVIGGIELEILDSDTCLHASKMGAGWGDGIFAPSVNVMLSMAQAPLAKTFPQPGLLLKKKESTTHTRLLDSLFSRRGDFWR